MNAGPPPGALRLSARELAPAWPASCAASDSEIIAALCEPRARISPKYFYDAAGSALFERITRLPEYYPTRTERAIMTLAAGELRQQLGAGATVIELGAGSCEKARLLCDLIQPRAYLAVDISADFLGQAVAGLRCALPGVEVRSLVADIEDEVTLPADLGGGQRLVFYPGSSIGNFDPEPAAALLASMRRLAAAGGLALIGVDLIKERSLLEAAYNDAAGITARFNLNALAHLNRLIGSDFDRRQWRHLAFFNAARSRIEMHLQATVDARVCWRGGERSFRRGECIHTENSYKYTIEHFGRMLERAGFRERLWWTDQRRWFALFLARA